MEFHGHKAGIWRGTLDALPNPVLVVGGGMRVVELNLAAVEFAGIPAPEAKKRRPGEILHCVGVEGSRLACGTAAPCQNCSLHDALRQFIESPPGEQPHRTVRIRVMGPDGARNLVLEASPLQVGHERLAVLVVNIPHDHSATSNVIPLCASCKRVRTGEGGWISLEEHVRRATGSLVTHTLCPECVVDLYPETVPMRDTGEGVAHTDPSA
jgi:PAS domain-containing protein